MVAKDYGRSYTAQSLREKAQIGKDGVSLLSIMINYKTIQLLIFSLINVIHVCYGQRTYRIECTFSAAFEGRETKLVVKRLNQPVLIDTVTIIDNQALFVVALSEPCPAYLWVENQKEDTQFFVDSPQINIQYSSERSKEPVIANSPETLIWVKQKLILEQVIARENELRMSYLDLINSKDFKSDREKTYSKFIDSLSTIRRNTVINLIESNPASASSWYLFTQNFVDFPYAISRKIFTKSSTFSSLLSYKAIKLNLKKKRAKKIDNLSLTDILGNEFTLSKINNSYLLIDFSDIYNASCKQRHELLREIYEVYGKNELTIITVYRESSQKFMNDLIINENLPWRVVSNGTGPLDIFSRCLIERTPDNLLIDSRRKVIARDISPETLNAILNKLIR